MTPLDEVIEEHRKDDEFRETWDKSVTGLEFHVEVSHGAVALAS
jgi:hypothetical protein